MSNCKQNKKYEFEIEDKFLKNWGENLENVTWLKSCTQCILEQLSHDADNGCQGNNNTGAIKAFLECSAMNCIYHVIREL